MPIVKDIDFNFKLSPITTLKMQKIATDFDLDVSQLGSLTGLVAMAACASNPALVLNMDNKDMEELKNELENIPEFNAYMKELGAPAKKLKTSNQTKKDLKQ